MRNANFLQWDLKVLSQLKDEIGLFDQIICFETIEHIMDDRKLIFDLSKLLNPGGRILLTTPYKYYNHLFGDKLSEYEDGGHVRWGYTHEEIKDIFVKCDIEIEVQEYIGGFIPQQLCNLERILSKSINSKFAWLIVFPLRIFNYIDRPITRVLKYPYLSIGVVGIKRK